MADVKKVIEIIDKIIADVDEQKLFLTELDNVIGDGDHGINLARGFDAVKTIEGTFEGKDIGAILKAIGMKLVSTVGGASGPLYGTAFMKSGALLNGKTEMDMNDFIEMLQVSIDGIMKRGKAVKGEKTMLDAMIPAHDAIAASYEADKDAKKALEAGVKAAEEGIEYTKTIIATKGRASYLGERSIGHQDPGATSFTLMLKAVQELAEEKGIRNMVGIVVVSHSQKLAEGVVELASLMAPETPMKAAGGMDDGGFGTSFEKITEAVEEVYSEDGVAIFMDLGSAVMTTEMVLESMEDRKIKMVDCPVAEGTIAAAVVAAGGASLEEVVQVAQASKEQAKF